MQKGLEAGVKSFFKKIINSIAAGMLWLLAAFTGGIYWRLGYTGDRPLWAVIIFYIFIITGLLLLLRYYLRIWKK